MKRLYFIICFIMLLAVLPIGSGAQKAARTDFKIEKGVNISAWLSQTGITGGQARLDYFTQKDLNELASLGFDHIRLPFNENQLYTKNGERNAETFTIIDNVVHWCKAANMRIILDCHQTAVHDFSKYSSITLFKNPEAQDSLVALWEKLAAEFKKYPNDLAAYEILNEPNARESESWNRVQMRVYKTLRKLEPSRIILMGSNKANKTYTFPELEFPKNDPNIILSFHFYYPYLITHYKASFLKSLAEIEVPLNYPGQLISDSVMKNIGDEETLKTLEKNNGVFNKQKLQEIMQPALDIAKKAGVRLHCGEFGVNFKYADRQLLARYLQDVVSIFKENNIPYSYWGYRKEFGVFTDGKKIKDPLVLNALVK